MTHILSPRNHHSCQPSHAAALIPPSAAVKAVKVCVTGTPPEYPGIRSLSWLLPYVCSDQGTNCIKHTQLDSLSLEVDLGKYPLFLCVKAALSVNWYLDAKRLQPFLVQFCAVSELSLGNGFL